MIKSRNITALIEKSIAHGRTWQNLPAAGNFMKLSIERATMAWNRCGAAAFIGRQFAKHPEPSRHFPFGEHSYQCCTVRVGASRYVSARR